MNTWWHDIIKQGKHNPSGLRGWLTYAAIFLFAYLFLAFGMKVEYTGLFLLQLALLIGVLGLRLWVIPAFLLMLQIDLVLNESPARSTTHGLGQILTAIMTLVMIVAASRYVVLCGSVAPYSDRGWFGRLIAAISDTIPWKHEPDAVGVPSRKLGTFSPFELISGLGKIITVVVVTTFLLAMFPLDPESPNSAGLTPAAVRTIQVGISLLIVGFVANQVVQTIRWKLLTSAEAELVMRNTWTNEFRGDWENFVDQQQKAKSKKST